MPKRDIKKQKTELQTRTEDNEIKKHKTRNKKPKPKTKRDMLRRPRKKIYIYNEKNAQISEGREKQKKTQNAQKATR